MYIYQLLTKSGCFKIKNSSSDIFDSASYLKVLKDACGKVISVSLAWTKAGSKPNEGRGWGWYPYHKKIKNKLKISLLLDGKI